MAMNQELYQRVIEDYAKTQSVERTARNCHCARVTAQKVLITEGLWSSRTSIAVGKLRAEGRSVKEIAGELHLTEKAVQAYTPYSRGMYGVETEDAKHSQDYRDRMNAAAERMAAKEDGGMAEKVREQAQGPGRGESTAVQEENISAGVDSGAREDAVTGESTAAREENIVAGGTSAAREDTAAGEEAAQEEVRDMRRE